MYISRWQGWCSAAIEGLVAALLLLGVCTARNHAVSLEWGVISICQCWVESGVAPVGWKRVRGGRVLWFVFIQHVPLYHFGGREWATGSETHSSSTVCRLVILCWRGTVYGISFS